MKHSVLAAAIGLAFICVNTAGFAETVALDRPAPFAFENISVPELPGGLLVGVTGLYLQPSISNSDLVYGTLFSSTAPNFNSSTLEVEPEYDWGWGVNEQYIFANTANDLSLSYWQLHTRDSDNVNNLTLGIIEQFTDLISPIAIANSTAKIDLDTGDLTAGQFIDVCRHLRLHPNAGVRYTSLDRKLNTAFQSDIVPPNLETNKYNEESKFEGFGPVVGMDANYGLGYGFGLAGHFDAALLIGRINSSLNFQLLQTLFSPIVRDLNAQSITRIVPAVDAKLGVDYNYAFTSTTAISLEVGYQTDQYFRVADRLIITSPLVDATRSLRRTANVAYDGGYVNLAVHFI